jgi:hypothetical protein
MTKEKTKEIKYFSLMIRENMGDAARKTKAKVTRPHRVKVRDGKKIRLVKFNTKQNASEWIAKHGDTKYVYFVVDYVNNYNYYKKWVYGHAWHTSSYSHPNERVMKYIDL